MGNGIGFVYAIYDRVLNKFYIGKKIYRSLRGLRKGKETDWRKYKSSSPLLEIHFKARPIKEFSFYCLEEYHTKSGLAYAETWTLCISQAPLSDAFYNKRIEGISFKVKEPISERHMARLEKLLERIKQ